MTDARTCLRCLAPLEATHAHWCDACHDYLGALKPRKEPSNLMDDRDDNSDGWSRGRADCE